MNPAAYEQRRYSAVAFSHPAIESFDDFVSLIDDVETSSTVLKDHGGNWDVRRFEYLHHRKLYPEHVVGSDESLRGSRFAHDMYLAVELPGRRSANFSKVFLASPYVQILEKVLSKLQTAVGAPAVRYVSVDMRLVYSSLAERAERDDVGVTKVTLQILHQPGLELVSLAGQNPLRSELHAAISEVAAPYAFRADFSVAGTRMRVNSDRHGNLWWYQTNEGRLAGALAMLEFFDSIGAAGLTRISPLDRADSEEVT